MRKIFFIIFLPVVLGSSVLRSDSKKDSGNFNQESLMIIGIPESNTVTEGTRYRAEIFAGDIISQLIKEIKVDGRRIQMGENGHGIYEILPEGDMYDSTGIMKKEYTISL